MKKVKILGIITVLIIMVVPSAMAILTGVNPDIHMDIPNAIANDFHMEGRIKSGFIGGNWSIPPKLVFHIDGGFPDFSYSITPDLTSPGQNGFLFKADWKGREFQYCQVLHLGLVFDLACHNLIIDLVGWWTYNGERLYDGKNQGAVLIPGFEVLDFPEDGRQKIQIRNDSRMLDQGIDGKIVRMNLAKLKREEALEMFGSLEELFSELQSNGRQNELRWSGIEGANSIPIEQNPPEFPVDSFFDVFVEIDLPESDFRTTESLALEPSDILVSRVGTEFINNAGEPDFRWTWHMHEAHHLDYGDAPQRYPVLLTQNGARHIIRGSWFGDQTDRPDRDPDGQPHPQALGDDLNDGNDDEDGIGIPILSPGNPASINVQVFGGGRVDAWIDYNQNFVWEEPAERIFGGFLPPGMNTINVNVPNSALPGQTFSRFRISDRGGLQPVGFCDNGEVEDHLVDIEEIQPIPKADLGDAPDSSNNYLGTGMTAYPGVPANYPTVYGTGSPPHGPIHLQPRAIAFLGQRVTLEDEADTGPDQDPTNNIIPPNDQPDMDLADDGVIFPITLTICNQNRIRYIVNVVAALANVPLYANVWFDWDKDGDWDDTFTCPDGNVVPEWAVRNQQLNLPVGIHTVTSLPFLAWLDPDTNIPEMWMRITLAEKKYEPVVDPTGAAGSGGAGLKEGYDFGETEDYLFEPEIIIPPDLDFGDAPDQYPTVLAANGARHIPGGPYFGPNNDFPDSEPNGQPTAQANGDDLDGNDDEDGVNIPVLIQGQPAVINLEINGGGGYVDAWIDFNSDGTWDEPGERIFGGFLSVGTQTIGVNVLPDAVPGLTYARFRISKQGGLTPEGECDNGEVEDYTATIREEPKPKAELGDAPDSSNNYGIGMTAYPGIPAHYPTVYGTGSPPHGPIHWQPHDLAFLGQRVTLEDEADTGPDEDPTNNIIPANDIPDRDLGDDGVIFPITITHCDYNTLDYVVTVVNSTSDIPIFVNIWFDWNKDGDWDDQQTCPDGNVVNEWGVQNQMLSLAPGVYTITSTPFLAWAGPDTALPELWMRITLSEQKYDPSVTPTGAPGWGGAGPEGGYRYGETEDYIFIPDIIIPPDLDFGDAPDQYPTVLAVDGARHIPGGPYFGPNDDVPDSEPDGQPTALANGDDLDGNDDEDGVTIPVLIQGQSVVIDLDINGGGGYVDAWIDFNIDGTWDEPGERIFGGFLSAGPQTIGVNVLASAVPGLTYARFRISRQGGLTPEGECDNGEVEDYTANIREQPKYDFGDAPDQVGVTALGPYHYRTVLANNGARHVLGSNIFMSPANVLPDAEPDGQPTINADGDDTGGIDDEDGVNFPNLPLVPGKKAKVIVEASQDCLLSAWIDFYLDGSFDQPEDKIFSDEPLVAGPNSLEFDVPLYAKQRVRTYARFRVSSAGGLNYYGEARDGEVEDYVVRIGRNIDIKWMQRPDTTPNGIDIRVDTSDGIQRVLADDFLCSNVERITDVHLWGSWNQDKRGRIRRVHLSFHSDDSVGPGGTDQDNIYSKPDELLWEKDFYEGEFTEKLFVQLEEIGEYWWDPFREVLTPDGDKQIWQVDIDIKPEEAFVQHGTEDKPIVYWLDVQVDTDEGEFGWKTRRWPSHYNDDAVLSEDGFNWKELRYPAGHAYAPLMFEDLAVGTEYFAGDVITTSGIDVHVKDFEWSNGTWTSAGRAVVDNIQNAGGSGNEINCRNVNLSFDFPTLYNLDLLYGEYGGNVNLEINGDRRNAANFDVLNGTLVGGVMVTILINPTAPSAYQKTMHLDGKIESFSIGGQELWVDNAGSGSIDMAFAITSKKVAGDFNGDGTADIIDALLAAQCFVGLIECPSTLVADVNCDGSTDIIDALLIAQYFVGLISSLECH